MTNPHPSPGGGGVGLCIDRCTSSKSFQSSSLQVTYLLFVFQLAVLLKSEIFKVDYINVCKQHTLVHHAQADSYNAV